MPVPRDYVDSMRSPYESSDEDESDPLMKLTDIQTGEEFLVGAHKYGRSVISECIASIMLNFIFIQALFSSSKLSFAAMSAERILFVSTTYGFAYASIMYAFSFPTIEELAYAEMRHINPAVSLALMLNRRVTIGRTLLNWVSQGTGVVASLLLVLGANPLVQDEQAEAITSYLVHDGFSAVHKFVVEAVTTFIAILIMSTTFYAKMENLPSFKNHNELIPITVHEANCLFSGLALCACSSAAAYVSGGIMNPAVAIGITMLTRDWSSLWPYCIGPFMGAIAAAILAEIIAARNDSTNEQDFDPSN